MRSATRAARLALALLLCAIASGALAQGGVAPALRDDLLASYDGATSRLLRLAEAMPAASFDWRPAEGVRSFSEVLLHVVEGNVHFAHSLGAAPEPKPVEAGSRNEVLALLRESTELAHRAIATLDPATLDESAEFFGMRSSRRRLVLLTAEHAHEHLGQAIAYARMNGVVPPWSR